jgi:hypothetical protein
MPEIEKQSSSCTSVATDRLVDLMVVEYGEKYRGLVVDVLTWLNSREPTWGLDTPLNRKEFLEDLIFRCDL